MLKAQARALLQLVLVVAFVGGAAMTVRWLVETRPSAPQRPVTEPVYAIKAVQAQAAFNQPMITVFGEVSARRAVELKALVAGPVVETSDRLIVGERVSAGEVLVRIDPFAYEGAVDEARANLVEAEAQRTEAVSQFEATAKDLSRIAEQVAIAERDLERARDLVRSRNVAQRTVDERELTLVQRRQSLEAAEASRTVQAARVEQKQAAVDRLRWRLRQAERNLEDTALRAPFDAIVRSENVGLGKRLSTNDVVAQIYEAGGLDVRFTLSDSQFGRLSADEKPLIGRKASLVWAVGGTPVKATARIDRIAPDVSSMSGGVAILARVLAADPATETLLRPGAFVSVSLADKGFADSVRLPEEALYDGDHLYVLKPVEVDESAPDAREVWRLNRVAARALAWDGSEVIVDAPVDGAWVMTSRLAEAGDGVKARIVVDDGPAPQSDLQSRHGAGGSTEGVARKSLSETGAAGERG
ncbi:MAG: HlyD family efflux transporter periplasmic adaptor subunit [Pseudomonadota bacterium]